MLIFPGFENKLLEALDKRALGDLDPDEPRARAVFVDALTASVLVPNTSSGWADAKAAAEALVDALPELLVRSAPDDTPLAPLRHLIDKDVAEVKEELRRLSGELGPLRTELALGLAVLLHWRGVAERQQPPAEVLISLPQDPPMESHRFGQPFPGPSDDQPLRN